MTPLNHFHISPSPFSISINQTPVKSPETTLYITLKFPLQHPNPNPNSKSQYSTLKYMTTGIQTILPFSLLLSLFLTPYFFFLSPSILFSPPPILFLPTNPYISLPLPPSPPPPKSIFTEIYGRK